MENVNAKWGTLGSVVKQLCHQKVAPTTAPCMVTAVLENACAILIGRVMPAKDMFRPNAPRVKHTLKALSAATVVCVPLVANASAILGIMVMTAVKLISARKTVTCMVCASTKNVFATLDFPVNSVSAASRAQVRPNAWTVVSA